MTPASVGTANPSSAAVPSAGRRRSASVDVPSTPEALLEELSAGRVCLDGLPAPARAKGVELLGPMAGSGHREAPSLVRRHDGQTIQLTALLYLTLQAMDGRRSYAEIAGWVGSRVGRELTAGDVVFLTEIKLRPLGVLRGADGGEPAVKRSNPLLALRCKVVVTDSEATRRITAPFARLFHPAAYTFFLTAFVLITGWLAFSKGFGSATHQAFYEPLLLLLVVGLTILSAAFHEFGHAAACRYGGATPGAMGAGLYLVWPAFYTDVSDSYTLDRRGRLRVDLGGLYFNAIFAVGIFAVWAVVGWDALLLVIGTQILQMLRQLTPLVRFDGYHILADLTGVPDLFFHIKPILRGLWPPHRGAPRRQVLKPWVRVVVTAWTLVVVPALATLLVLMIMILPRLAATAWDSLGIQVGYLLGNWANGDLPRMGVGVVSILALCVPVLSITYLLTRIIWRTARRLWASAGQKPIRRGGLMLAGLLLLAGAGWLWGQGDGQPIEPHENGTLPELFGLLAYDEEQDAAAAVDVGDGKALDVHGQLRSHETGDSSGSRTVAVESAGVATRVASPKGPEERATERSDHAVPPGASGPRSGIGRLGHDGPDLRPEGGTATDAELDPDAGPPVDGWPFPFPRPGAVGPDDNRAYLYNTRDGSTQHEVALSLLQTDRSPVTNRNEAWALASCRDCKTVAVAFQVVLITAADAPVVTPANMAVSVNSECESCVTHGVSVQLVATMPGAPSTETWGRIQTLMAQLEPLRAHAAALPLEHVRGTLLATKAEIIQVLAAGEPDAVIEDVVAEEGDVAPDDVADDQLEDHELGEAVDLDEPAEGMPDDDVDGEVEPAGEPVEDTEGEEPTEDTGGEEATEDTEGEEAVADTEDEGQPSVSRDTEDSDATEPDEGVVEDGAEEPSGDDAPSEETETSGADMQPPAKEPEDGTEVLDDDALQEAVSSSQTADAPDDDTEADASGADATPEQEPEPIG